MTDMTEFFKTLYNTVRDKLDDSQRAELLATMINAFREQGWNDERSLFDEWPEYRAAWETTPF